MISQMKRAFCGGAAVLSLWSLDKKTGFLTLSHFTVKEFLMDEKLLVRQETRRYHLRGNNSHATMAKVSLTCICLDDFAEWGIGNKQSRADKHRQHLFLGTPLVCAVRGNFNVRSLKFLRRPNLKTIQMLLQAGAKGDSQVIMQELPPDYIPGGYFLDDFRSKITVTPMSLALDLIDTDLKQATKILAELLDANVAAKDKKFVPHLPILSSLSGSMLTLYRGHSDMPTELRAKLPSIAASRILKKTREEIGEDEEDWALTDKTAARLIELIDSSQIVFEFPF
ncbi:hypothetical protein G7Y89_g3033 [Cudoniella acicularis]|uniref:Uncharacterized protein n=1 Tax=Cudoniella acicularis TaxID=354080 RepID=A0A8H4RTD1_9HELO|nr:hypothetical protein G7Y89_g3033 [Cudoniella acicularis]